MNPTLKSLARQLASEDTPANRARSAQLMDAIRAGVDAEISADARMADELLLICSRGLSRLADRAAARGQPSPGLATASRVVSGLTGFSR